MLDDPRGHARSSWAWWAALTGTSVADVRGSRQEFATLDGGVGDPWVKVQAIEASAPRVHLDLDVNNVAAAAVEAERLGATRIGAIGNTVVIMESPGGFVFCLTTWHGASTVGPPQGQPLIHSVCLDLPPGRADTEEAFWKELTGWAVVRWQSSEFTGLTPPLGQPCGLMLQRLHEAEPGAPVTAHVDLDCPDATAAVARAVAMRAEVVTEQATWTVLRDPWGRVFCLTGA